MSTAAGGWGLFILRLAMGSVFIAHGAQKLFGAFGGPGLKGFSGFLGSMGIKPAMAWAVATALVEFVGGLFLVLGFLTRISAGLIAVVMAMAFFTVHLKNGFFVDKHGFEFVLVLLAAAIALALLGPGNFALKK
jgi:putative oxidoreductase